MGVTESDKELIERCVGAEASEEDLLLFEERCKDPLFREEAEIARLLVDQIVATERSKLREELHQQLSSLELPKKNPSANKFFYYAAAAIVLLLIVAYFLLPTGVSSDRLYAEYYTPFPVATTRGDHDEEWRIFYSKSDYANAEKALLSAIESKGNPALYVALGNCYLNLEDTGKAKSALATAMKSGDTLLVKHATWYFALTLLKEGDWSGCKKELEKLTSSPYSSKANEIIQKIDQQE